MSIAHDIMKTPDRTPKERRDMAEIRHVGPIDWEGNTVVCRFRDDSALMMVLDDDLCPTEFLAINPPLWDEALKHASSCLEATAGWDGDTLSHNIESNFPDLDIEDCDEIAGMVLR